MIKQLLFASILFVPCVQSVAQSIKKADNVTMYSISENGKYACSANEGVVVLWNTEKDNNTTTFDDQYYYCDGVSNDGMMAGSTTVRYDNFLKSKDTFWKQHDVSPDDPEISEEDYPLDFLYE